MTIEEIHLALKISPVVGVDTFKEAESLRAICEQEGHRGLEIIPVHWGEDAPSFKVEQTYNIYGL